MCKQDSFRQQKEMLHRPTIVPLPHLALLLLSLSWPDSQRCVCWTTCHLVSINTALSRKTIIFLCQTRESLLPTNTDKNSFRSSVCKAQPSSKVRPDASLKTVFLRDFQIQTTVPLSGWPVEFLFCQKLNRFLVQQTGLSLKITTSATEDPQDSFSNEKVFLVYITATNSLGTKGSLQLWQQKCNVLGW